MTLLPRRARPGATLTLSALAVMLLAGGAFAQGYGGTQNGGSTTQQGTGTAGGSNVNGAGPAGPRDPTRMQQPYNTSPSAQSPGIATAPTSPAPSNSSDRQDPNVNPQHGNGH